MFRAAPTPAGGHLDYAGIRDKMTYISNSKFYCSAVAITVAVVVSTTKDRNSNRLPKHHNGKAIYENIHIF